MNNTTTKKDLIDRLALRTGCKRADVRDVATALFDLMINELAEGNRLEFRDFGVFELKRRRARRAQNPRTLEPVKVPPRHSVKFKPGRLMRERLDELSRRIAADAEAGLPPLATISPAPPAPQVQNQAKPA
jgi:integration host factor subunit beta